MVTSGRNYRISQLRTMCGQACTACLAGSLGGEPAVAETADQEAGRGIEQSAVDEENRHHRPAERHGGVRGTRITRYHIGEPDREQVHRRVATDRQLEAPVAQ